VAILAPIAGAWAAVQQGLGSKYHVRPFGAAARKAASRVLPASSRPSSPAVAT